jgi:hypothetical protein
MSNAFRLEEATLGTLNLDPFLTGIVVESYDAGFPAPRVVSDPFPDAGGTIDTTSLYGPRLITLVLRIVGDRGTRQSTMFTLRRWWQPSLRPAFVWQGDGMPVLRAVGRGQQLTNTVSGGAPYKVQAQFVVPLGVWEAYVPSAVSLPPSAGATAVGRTYDLTFDRTYPALSAPLGTTLATANGTVPVDFVAFLRGPVAGVGSLENLTTGRKLVFTANGGLALAAGDYLQVDTRNRTVLLNGTATHYDLIDWTQSQWWQLQPGGNTLRWNPTTPSTGAIADMTWRDAWI